MNNSLSDDEKYLVFYDYIIKVLSICKIGKIFSSDPYALENYEQLEKLSMDMLEKYEGVKFNRPNYFSRDVYPTPNVSARCCIFKDNKVLLVQEAIDGGYSVPGGWCDLFDTPKETVYNECLQEAGVKVKDIDLIGILSKSNTPDNTKSVPEYILVFRADLEEDLNTHTHETIKKDWFEIDNLPRMSAKNTLENWKLIINNSYSNIKFCN